MFILRIPSRLLYDLCFPRCELFNYLGVYGLALQHSVLRFHPHGLVFSRNYLKTAHLGLDMPIWGVPCGCLHPRYMDSQVQTSFFFFFNQTSFYMFRSLRFPYHLDSARHRGSNQFFGFF